MEDEATIILTYHKTQVIIQASWNWPYSRKDMEIYGKTGFLFCKDATNIQVQETEKKQTIHIAAPALPAYRNDPFIYFAKLIRGEIKMDNNDLSASGNNEIVMKILELAKLSVQTGKTIVWNEYFKK